VNLLDRRSNLLVARIDALRDAVRQVRARPPFHIDAWVVLCQFSRSLAGDQDRVCKIVAHQRAAITWS